MRMLRKIRVFNNYSVLEPEWAIDSEAMIGPVNNCFSKIQVVGQKYRE